jgi:hypothetical protein
MMRNRQGAAASNGAGRRPPTLAPSQLADDGAWYVDVRFPDGRSEEVGTFRDESETSDWIAHKSDAWLADYERRRISERWDQRAPASRLRIVR